jgi:hypothetical protein
MIGLAEMRAAAPSHDLLSADIRRQMKEAVAAFATRRHTLAQHQPGALEGQKIGLAPRRVVEMDARSRLARLHLGAEID